MFFKVSVVGIAQHSNQSGAIMVLGVGSVKPLRANPSLHPTCYSGLRPLPQAGELKR
jgi:hypothetical protein